LSTTALVTGASSGIGESFARLLAGSGHDLVLTARRSDRLEALAAELRAAHHVTVDEVVADLATAHGRSVVASTLAEGRIDLLINNAGFGVYTPVAETSPEVLDAMVELNVLAVLQLTRAVLPGMIERQSGTIINVASGLAFDPTPTRATYSATKGFVVNYSRALQQEVQAQGVRVQVLIPGLIRTEFHDHSGTDIHAIPDAWLMDPTDLARASLRGVELGETVCIPALRDVEQITAVLQLQSDLTRTLVTNGTPADRYRS
jgi:short-subunit dehydrogenase